MMTGLFSSESASVSMRPACRAPVELFFEPLALILRRDRRDEGTGLELWVLERAVIPIAQLPADAQHRQRRAVIADTFVTGGIAGTPHIAEKLRDLASMPNRTSCLSCSRKKVKFEGICVGVTTYALSGLRPILTVPTPTPAPQSMPATDP